MRVEKFSLPSFDGSTLAAVVEGAMRRPYVPPSLVPEAPRNLNAEPPQAPTFSEADLKKAEQEGYRKGFLEGTREGRMQSESEQAEVDRKLSETVEQLASRLHEIITQYNSFAAEQRKELPQLALTIARKVAGDALNDNPLPLIESIVTACLERVLGEPHITVTVNDKLSDALEHRLISHFANNTDPGEISIHGEAALPLGDCRIDWERGKAERNTGALWQQMENLIRDIADAGQAPDAQAAASEQSAPPADFTPPS